ncbi:unnamed protein product [Allacma fusca]|uniref:PIH1 domain-containing protein 1 n=1 Tax=Allacma fusca TaxID=39272 RepID=A0A8J2J5I9_9HEXA|nr:unnamed protein product [Allacma fusca]
MPNFLEVDESLISSNLMLNDVERPQDFLDSLIKVSSGDGVEKIFTPSDRKEQSQAKFIIPAAGLCVKTKDLKNGVKFFLNMCTSDDVAQPEFDYPDDKLAEILDDGNDEEVDEIRIPMSIGDLHKDKDRSGVECVACDVIINTDFFSRKISKSEMYRTFLIVVAFEGVEEKHKLQLDKNGYAILHNRKSFGKLTPQFVRQKPGIKEIKDSTGPFASTQSTTSSLIQESKKPKLVQEMAASDFKLDYKITQVSSDLAVAEIKLPNLRVPSKLGVKLGADRIIIESPNGCLDIFVPLDIHQEEARADYDHDLKLLTLQLPLIPKI